MFSHWVPGRYIRPLSRSRKNLNPDYKPWLDNVWGRWFVKSRLNGRYVSQRRHFKHDDYYYGNSKDYLDWDDKWSGWRQQFDRIPYWKKVRLAPPYLGHTLMERLRTVPVSDWLTKISDGEWSFIGLLDRLTKWAFPPTLRLSPLEKRLYAEAVRKLPPDAAAAVERQMAEYNLVQRDVYKKMTHFYSIRRGKEGFPDALRFPERQENFKFASIKFRVPGSSTEYKANFWGMRGRFFRITFNNTIKDIMGRDDIEIVKTTVRPAGLV